MSVALARPACLPGPAQADLAAAFAKLERLSLAVRLANAVGQPVEALKARLPAPVQSMLDAALRQALKSAMQAALLSDPARGSGAVSATWFHRGLAAATGAAGGAFGLPGTLAELPISTTLLLRQIAAVAAAEGEDLGRPEAAAECLKVFALGGRNPGDDAAESGYFAVRFALVEALKGVAGKGLAGLVLPGFLGPIAARFGGPVALKLSAQAAPLIGAVAGAAVNLAFLEHFRSIGEGHFVIRRLERAHGAEAVRAAYAALAETRDARFNG